MTLDETSPSPAPRKRRGGRPRCDPERRRNVHIRVYLSVVERAQVRAKADALRLSTSDFMRQAALARRLKPPPVAAVNREQYIELARLAEDLHELLHRCQAGHDVAVAQTLLQCLIHEVGRLRLGLIGVVPRPGGADCDVANAANSSSALS